jgi:hypothetical protein
LRSPLMRLIWSRIGLLMGIPYLAVVPSRLRFPQSNAGSKVPAITFCVHFYKPYCNANFSDDLKLQVTVLALRRCGYSSNAQASDAQGVASVVSLQQERPGRAYYGYGKDHSGETNQRGI